MRSSEIISSETLLLLIQNTCSIDFICFLEVIWPPWLHSMLATCENWTFCNHPLSAPQHLQIDDFCLTNCKHCEIKTEHLGISIRTKWMSKKNEDRVTETWIMFLLKVGNSVDIRIFPQILAFIEILGIQEEYARTMIKCTLLASLWKKSQ